MPDFAFFRILIFLRALPFDLSKLGNTERNIIWKILKKNNGEEPARENFQSSLFLGIKAKKYNIAWFLVFV